MKIPLTTQETSLFEKLKKAAESIKVQQPDGTVRQPVVRVAGGWVRDKILAVYNQIEIDETQSPDIDIAIDCLTGIDFAHHVNHYLENHQDPEFDPTTTSSIGVIRSNPDQSKHLEVAVIKIDGIKLDCLNLRTETYANTSRIPTIEIGTPQEDAFRRDFTSNALFYNINTEQVEDFTNIGLQDIKNKTLRTPLDPKITFLDDPLRALRGIRFACRFNFTIEDSVFQAMKTNQFLNSLISKVSKERISAEIHSALETGDHQICTQLLHDSHILKHILTPSGLRLNHQNETDLTPEDEHLSNHGYQISKMVLDYTQRHSFDFASKKYSWHPEDAIKRKCLLTYASLILPQELEYRKKVHRWLDDDRESTSSRASSIKSAHLPPQTKRLCSMKTATYADYMKTCPIQEVYRQGLKYPTKIVTQTLEICNGVDMLLYKNVFSKDENDKRERRVNLDGVSSKQKKIRLNVGYCVRQLRENWILAFILAAATVVAARSSRDSAGYFGLLRNFVTLVLGLSEETEATGRVVDGLMELKKSDQELMDGLMDLVLAIDQEDVFDAWAWRPVVDGKVLAGAFEMKKGPLIGEILENLILWQLYNTDVTEGKALDFVARLKPELKRKGDEK